MSSTSKPKNERGVGIWYLIRFMSNYKGRIAGSVFFLILASVASSLQPVWLKKIIDLISKGTTLQGLTSVLIIFFSLKIGEALFEFLRDIIFAPAEMGVWRTVSESLFTHMIHLSVNYHNEQQIGGTSRKISRGGRAVSFILDFVVSNILPTIFTLVFVTIVLFKLYAPVYAIVIFLTTITYAVFTLYATDKRQVYRLAANAADDEVSAIELGSLTNIDTVKYFNNETYQLERYTPVLDKRYNLNVASNNLFSFVSGVQGLILAIGLGIILYLGILQNLRGEMTIGDLVLLTTYVAQLAAPISVLGFIYRQIKDGLADLDGMAKIMEEEISIKEPEYPVDIAHPEGKIEFNDVHFQYPSGREVLKGISLAVKPGQKVAFVGPSGAGKSTIVKLLFRLYELSAGEILIDNVPLDDIAKTARRDIFSIVPQEPVLFNTTIAENIRFGKPDATEEEIEAAAKLANVHTFIKSLPNGYETTVGERGVKLSGGEKQRVAIARSVIKNPRVLVFDEATSALDSHNEEIIQESLERVSKGRTTIAIAHRLSTIADSDVIYVLKDGAIAESGTHTQLLEKGGVYAEMWKIQAEQKDAEIVLETLAEE